MRKETVTGNDLFCNGKERIMLHNLHVKNLALIEEAEVDFSEGLNILSGETGAGKSIIIGSIGVAIGEKVSKDMIRKDADYALVELVFSVDEQVSHKLVDMDIPMEDDQVILTRRISGGRSIAKINSESVSAAKLREAASLLIDIHGQHEHQSLLNQKNHLHILDAYAKKELKDMKEKLSDAYHAYIHVKNELKEAATDTEQRARELSFLQYEAEEIEHAALTVGEDEELEIRYRRFANGKQILGSIGQVYELTSDHGAAQMTGHAVLEIAKISAYDEKVRQLEEQLTQIDDLLNDFNRELAGYMDDTDFDEERFYEMEKRLDLINGLKAKYGGTIEKILAEYEKKLERIEKLSDYDAYLSDLTQKLEKKETELETLCKKVSAVRRKEASKLAKKIKSALIDLNFLDVQFELSLTRKKDYTASGYDEAEFLISTNPGEPVQSLTKIASGGELSRIMLAIKAVLADCDEIGTLIFDEIDTGISGRTAQMVSEKMNVISKDHQIICITHLPQIAAMADTHFLIEKQAKKNQTHTSIRKLDSEESVSELGRMLGGVKITDTVLKSAKEMKDLAVATKNSQSENNRS
uniref:DNA repair protein RecN n=1 Tax=Eubacterium plexicaudatum ASF492 TaxID=1235802 RepID=N2A3T6_9FIRM